MTLLQRLGYAIHQRPGFERFLDRLLRPVEALAKKPPFGCQMCGQCVLHATGMVCPMTCPKKIRNGPCGGVALDGSCEVNPDLTCVWTTAVRRAQWLPWPDELHDLHPPVDWTLQGSSSWINHLTGRDQIRSGCTTEPENALELVPDHGK